MRHTTQGAIALGAGAVLLLTACTAAPAARDAVAASPPTSTASPSFGPLGSDEEVGYTRTEIGNAEGAGVDLSQVLSLEGGD